MKIAVIGAGSWGTAIAQMLATKGYNVNMWARRPDQVKAINTEHKNPRYLTDIELSKDVVATLSYEDCIRNASAAVVVTPSKLLRGVARALYECTPHDLPIIILSKGVEAESGFLATEIFEQEMGNPDRLAVLSGPNHAEEVVKGIPCGTVIASKSVETAGFFQELFRFDTFRAYTSSDIVGVQLCGAYKNIIAISVGISYGLGFGDNTASTLLARGLAEMSRLVDAMDGQSVTCMGLAGVGDLVATSMSQHSRNRKLGEMIAAGKTLDDFKEETHMVAEGALACRNILVLGEQCGIELPLADGVRKLVWEGADPHDLSLELLARPLKPELPS